MVVYCRPLAVFNCVAKQILNKLFLYDRKTKCIVLTQTPKETFLILIIKRKTFLVYVSLCLFD